jgi:phenylacetate-CoA ligase
MQLRKFRRLVAFANARSPFYRRVIAERGIRIEHCVPEDFPVLTKQEAAWNFDQLVTDPGVTRARVAEFLARSNDPRDLLDGRYRVLHTSGTSGVLGYSVFSREAWVKGASHAARAAPLGWRRRVAFLAATEGHFAGVSLILTGNEGTNSLFYNVRPFDVGRPLASLIEELNEFQPQALSGYGTALKSLAEAQERGELRIRPRFVGNGGEPLQPDTRQILERVFRTRVLNAYASSEHLYMAMTFHKRDGMHLLEDDLIFELRDDHTLVTNLFNELMPLIRYRMDDVLVPDMDGPNPLPFRKVKSLVGRREHSLTFVNEHGETDWIHPIVIVELMAPGVSGWQIALKGDTHFVARARLQDSLTESEGRLALQGLDTALRSILEKKEMRNVTFEIEVVDQLPLDPKSGKFRLVTREPDAREQPTPV